MASTTTTLPRPTVASADITDGSIVNEDVSASAAIALSKLGNSGGAAGDIIYWNGSAWTRLAKGTDGYLLSSAATPAWVVAPATSGALRTISFTIAQAATTDSTATLPANAIVHNCQVIVTTQYSSGGTIAVGQSGSTTAFQATTDNDADGATANDIFEKVQYTTTSAAAIRATVGGSPAAGAARIVVFYSVPDV